MQNERIKNLTMELSDLLELTSIDFMVTNLGKKEKTSDLLDLVISGNISNMINLMKRVATDDPYINLKVNKFIEKIMEFLCAEHTVEFKQREEH